MRCLARFAAPVLLLFLAGCSSTVGSRLGARPGTRSIAMVGDRPMPANSGEPGTQVASEAPEPEPRRNPRARISGRVVDEQGRPAPGVTVRLADGGSKGGRDIRSTTDRSGAFTLNGLRPGSSYSLVAESEDDLGRRTGRAEAEASETGVEISLVGPDEPSTNKVRSGRATRAKPISSREERVGREQEEESPSLNHEDLPLAEEAGEPEPVRRPASGRPRLSAPEPSVGWRGKGQVSSPARKSELDVEEVASSANEETDPRPRRASASESESEEDGFNPLPPAINRRRPAPVEEEPEDLPSPKPKNRRKSDDLGTVMPNADGREMPTLVGSSAPERQVVISEPPRMPTIATGAAPESLPSLGGRDEAKPSVASSLTPPVDPPPVASADPPGPTSSPPDTPALTQDESHPIPAPQPVFASTPPKSETPATPPPPGDYNPFLLATAGQPAVPIETPERPAPPTAPAPADPPVIAANTSPAPVSEVPDSPPAVEVPEATSAPPRKKWGELAKADRPAAGPETTRAGSLLRKRIMGTPDRKDVSLSLCSYDSRLRKIVDFRLPDLEGKPVRFQDLDADFILLDFWGTWYPPCLESIPHLVGLQKEYGPQRLRVVGIACEQAPPEQRKARIEEASRKYGINYAILLSGMDGKPCPVQESLQIQAYPTTILVDRTGRILWRNAGSTSAARDRLDRVLAGLSRSDTVRR